MEAETKRAIANFIKEEIERQISDRETPTTAELTLKEFKARLDLASLEGKKLQMHRLNDFEDRLKELEFQSGRMKTQLEMTEQIPNRKEIKTMIEAAKTELRSEK